jgi:hypothetical protein
MRLCARHHHLYDDPDGLKASRGGRAAQAVGAGSKGGYALADSGYFDTRGGKSNVAKAGQASGQARRAKMESLLPGYKLSVEAACQTLRLQGNRITLQAVSVLTGIKVGTLWNYFHQLIKDAVG